MAVLCLQTQILHLLPFSASFKWIFFFPGFEREKEDCFFACTARRNVVQEVNEVCPEVQFAKAKPPDLVGKSSFNSAR